MTNPNFSNGLIASLNSAKRILPALTWSTLRRAVEKEQGSVKKTDVERVIAQVTNAEVRWQISEHLAQATGTMWSDVALVMRTIEQCAPPSGKVWDVVWSGPSSASLAARRIDQILYDLLIHSKTRVFIVSFSAYRVAHLCDALASAHKRGVKITLLLETAEDSDGQLNNDALNAFNGLPLHAFELLHWPKNERALNGAGKPGKLHAKCAVIDDAVIISSANLTNDAFNNNMEMGIAVNSADFAETLLAHFGELNARGIIKDYPLAPRGSI
jgi:phosphatidylserine/phosphatidylglycerophosphate/cardiolipin synthase-like enzyme